MQNLSLSKNSVLVTASFVTLLVGAVQVQPSSALQRVVFGECPSAPYLPNCSGGPGFPDRFPDREPYLKLQDRIQENKLKEACKKKRTIEQRQKCLDSP
jgi:hypothetical protein